MDTQTVSSSTSTDAVIAAANAQQAAIEQRLQALASAIALPLANQAHVALTTAQRTQFVTLEVAQTNVSLALQTLNGAQGALTGVAGLLKQQHAIASQALTATDPTSLADLAKQYDELADQIDTLVSNASFNGVNLVSSSPSSLRVDTTDAGGQVTVNGVASDAQSLGLPIATGNFSNPYQVEAALVATNNALGNVTQTQANFAAAMAALEAAQLFNQNEALQAAQAAAFLTNSDIAAQAATALADRKTQEKLALAAEEAENLVQAQIAKRLFDEHHHRD